MKIQILERFVRFISVLFSVFAVISVVNCGGGGSGSNGTIPPSGHPIVDVTGIWSLYHTQSGGIEQGPDLLSMMQTGNNISGTAMIGSNAANITGAVSGKNITLSLLFSSGQITSLTGAISDNGDSISGTYSNPTQSGMWRAERKAPLTSISVRPANPSIAEGATLQLTATGTYADGTTNDLTRNVHWNSSSTSIVTVNNDGLATGISLGTSTITATLGGILGSTILTVSQSAFQGSLQGKWQVTCPLFSRQGSWSGQFTTNIDANGDITGNFSGDLSGPISGHVDATGSLSGTFEVTMLGSNPVLLSWRGQLTVSGTSMSGMGTLTSDVCYGLGWQGAGTVSH